MTNARLSSCIPWVRTLIPFGVSVATLLGLTLMVDVTGLGWALQNANLWLIGLAALKLPLLVLLWSLRWYWVVSVGQEDPIPFRFVVHAALIRSFFNNLTPGVATGGEPFGAYYLAARTSLTFKEAIASTAAERMVQGLVMVLILVLAVFACLPMLPVSSEDINLIYLGLSGFLVVVGAAFYLSLFQFRLVRMVLETAVRAIVRFVPRLEKPLGADRLRENLDGFYLAYRQYLRSPTAVSGIVLLTIVQGALDIIQPYLLFKALNVNVPLAVILLTANLARILGIFGFTPGGAGIIEAMNLALYHGLSTLSPHVILAQTVLFRLLDSWLLWIVSGIVTSIVWTSESPSSNPKERNDDGNATLQACALSAD